MGMKVMVRSKLLFRVAIGMSALAVLSNPVAAELLVSGASGIDGFAVGAKFSDDYVFKLPAKSELRLLRSPDNTPFVMHGPFEGTLSHFIENCNGFLAPIRSYCRNTAGDQPPIGATRSMRRPND
jgi:hypothetical protein